MRTTRIHARLATLAAAAVVATTAVVAPAAAEESAPAGASATHERRAALAERIEDRLPDDVAERLEAELRRRGIEPPPAQEAIERRLRAERTAAPIDPDDYTCSPTRWQSIIEAETAEIDPTTLYGLQTAGATLLPLYDALIFGTPRDPDFAIDRYGHQIRSAYRGSQEFWDVSIDDVDLLKVDDGVLTDPDRVARVFVRLTGMDPAEARQTGEDIRELYLSDPALAGGDSPVFSAGAWASIADPASDENGLVMIGDGTLTVLERLGLSEAGPFVVTAHEMVHHLAAANPALASPESLDRPQSTRRDEMLADGFATYFAAHPRGGRFAPTQLLDAAETFANVGDCSYDNPGHHGTPNQRTAASAWGAAVVAYTKPARRVLPSTRLGERFDEALPVMLRPDAPLTARGYRAIVQ